jgi:hypothetical protein
MNMHAAIEELSLLCNGKVNTTLGQQRNCYESVFSVGSALRLYNKDPRPADRIEMTTEDN